jgi:non-ribosomal peptide synthetase component F
VEAGRFQAEDYYFTIDDELRDGLIRTAAENRVTLNTLFQTLWGLLLQRYTGSSDVLFGAIVSGRPPFITGIERMVGLFINIAPVRLRTGKTKYISGLLKDMQRRSVLSKPYETLPLADILSNASLKPGIIDNIMFFENYPGHEEMDTRLKVRLLENYEQIDYNFSFYVVPGAVLTVRFSFNSLVFDMEFIKRIALDFKALAVQVVENPFLEPDAFVESGRT